MCGMSSYVAMSFLQISRPPVIILNFDVSNLEQKNISMNSQPRITKECGNMTLLNNHRV